MVFRSKNQNGKGNEKRKGNDNSKISAKDGNNDKQKEKTNNCLTSFNEKAILYESLISF